MMPAMSYSSAAEPGIDRRLAPRSITGGEVVLRPYDHSLLQGQIVDVSSGGFRIRYVGKRMRVGAEVEIIHPWNNLKAVLAWTIRSGEWIHAGFSLIPLLSEDDAVAEA
jgi:hypothetical protein